MISNDDIQRHHNAVANRTIAKKNILDVATAIQQDQRVLEYALITGGLVHLLMMIMANHRAGAPAEVKERYTEGCDCFFCSQGRDLLKLWREFHKP